MTTLGEYMHWLRGTGGSCRTGIGPDPDIGMVPVTKLTAPNGLYVIHPGDNQYEVLSTFTIERYDRRLKVLSPFRSVPRG